MGNIVNTFHIIYFFFTKKFHIFINMKNSNKFFKKLNMSSMSESEIDSVVQAISDQQSYREMLEDNLQLAFNSFLLGVQTFDQMFQIHLMHFGDGLLPYRHLIQKNYYDLLFTNIQMLSELDEKSLQDMVLECTSDQMQDSFSKYLDFFIDLEEYEKCAVIKNLLTILEKKFIN